MSNERLERTDRLIIPEGAKILMIDPVELIADNPAALIVNRDSYESMKAHFSSTMFYTAPPQVARVRVYTPNGLVTKLFVVDGLTRTKFAADHKGKVLPEALDVSFDLIQVVDVTDDVLRDPRIASLGEAGQKELTMPQFLRKVIPPTIEHSQIAPDRMAGHMINGWISMVGVDMAKTYSAMAAITYLLRDKNVIPTDDQVKKRFEVTRELIAGESLDERVRLQNALLEMATVMRETKLYASPIMESTFALVSTGSPVIGGEQEIKKQIYGILHRTEVEEKLLFAYPQEEDYARRESEREKIGRFILEALRQISVPSQKENALKIMDETLIDPKLSLDDVLDVLTSPSPSRQYDQLVKLRNRDKLRETYLAVKGKINLTEAEEVLIDNLGKKRNLDDRSLVINAIELANDVLQKTAALTVDLARARDEMIQSGVKPETIDQELESIRVLTEGIYGEDSFSNIKSKARELGDNLRAFRQRVTWQQRYYRTTLMFEESFGTGTAEEYGVWFKDRTITWLLAPFQATPFAPLDEVAVRRRISQIRGLSGPLLLQVVNGEMTIEYALKRQEMILAEVSTRTRAVEKTVEITKPSAVIDQKAEEEKRKAELESRISEINTALNELIDFTYVERLKNLSESLDPKPSEIRADIRERIYEIFRILGKLGFGEKDAVHIIENYPHLRQENISLRETIVDIQNEIAARDTRTGR